MATPWPFMANRHGQSETELSQERLSRRLYNALAWYFTCAPGRTRTYDARFRKPTLYPLSYGGGGCRKRGRKPDAKAGEVCLQRLKSTQDARLDLKSARPVPLSAPAPRRPKLGGVQAALASARCLRCYCSASPLTMRA
jgi:hypothetical protein